MAVQAFPYLVITDGTTTVTLATGAAATGSENYALVRGEWAPNVAGRRLSELGGRGPYEDVVEDFLINVRDTTAAGATNKLAALNRLLEQAAQWDRGDNVSAVLVKYAPQGSTVASDSAPYQAVILGPVRDQRAGVGLPRDFNDVGMLKEIRNVRVRFVRRGLWVLSTTIDGSSAAVANPGPYPITGMTTHPNLSPAKVTLEDLPADDSFDVADTKPILLLAGVGSDLQIAEAEAGTATAYTSVADTTNLARGGSVLRYTPAGTTEVTSGQISLSSMTSSARRFAFFAAIRNNSASTTFQIRLGALVQVKATGSVNTIAAYTPKVYIDVAHVRPRYIPLGEVSLPSALKAAQLLITASAASGTLDIDYIIALALDNPYARTIQFDVLNNTGAYEHTAAADLIIDPRVLTGTTPIVYRNFQGTSDNDPLGYYGDIFPIASSTTYTAALMAKNTRASSVTWCYANAAVSAGESLTLTVNRYNGYLVPE